MVNKKYIAGDKNLVQVDGKRNNPDALTADLPPIDPPKKRGRPRK
jgi:hypothetical protein